MNSAARLLPFLTAVRSNGSGLEVFQDPQIQSAIEVKVFISTVGSVSMSGHGSVGQSTPRSTAKGQRGRSGRPHDVPGTVSIHGRIVNLYGQLLPGRPADDAPMGGWPGTGRFVSATEAAEDTRGARFRWFEAGLASLARAVPSSCSLALPTRIGCGLAGGRWPQYLAALKRFCEENRNLSVVLYDIEGSEATGYEAAQAAPAAASVPRPRANPEKSSGSSAFWSSATFEVLRDGQWTPYPQARQEELRAALLREDDCLEVLVDAERRSALTALQELGACPRSLGGGVESSAASLVVRWDDGEGPVEVNLASIVSLAALGEERSPQGTARVRLHLPAVREGTGQPGKANAGQSTLQLLCGHVQVIATWKDSFTIVMNFRFPGGRDAKGEPFAGRSQQAFLPHDEQGKLLLALFQLAFRRRVMFDLRVSATDEKYWPAFNIHLKTALAGGPERFGFPDESYSQRVLEELRQNGVTVAEL
ncbi:DTX3 [Symbiodinium sp. KB8]|nr:DTX3 [Symbiodinium sp. KB8]